MTARFCTLVYAPACLRGLRTTWAPLTRLKATDSRGTRTWVILVRTSRGALAVALCLLALGLFSADAQV